MEREERVNCVDVTINELTNIYKLGDKPPKYIEKEYKKTIDVLKDLKEIIKYGQYI